eukprot:gnl/TRDRNA2_/TRDRNA2_182808_c0_seq1.p1 gnl/TRDRNA2_/TRDRNA2_182808_c0~~gnl/TRDRNA2_/TRDRNA2_182808_c0_seq1.p1  ORF type:complete len:278 (+),score=43.95 gnl/TRDRNA2_/TRDRNA2_182808_c0_seq1:68-901(+)
MGFKIPEPPVIVAGGLGGPFVMLLVTPARNGLTLGATNSEAGALSLYRQVFAGGLRSGWTGGIYPAMAACPQFLCLGPAYHFFASYTGAVGGTILASCTETAIVYGAECKNAQMAKNSSSPGTFKTLHPSWKPWGPGVGIHAFRNVVATAGLRLFCTPCTWLLEKATGTSNTLTTVGGDFLGNVGGACLSAPVHQVYNFTVTTPELQQMSTAEMGKRMQQFLRDQYLVTENGKTTLSKCVPRDLFMRSMYVAVAYTIFSNIERGIMAAWPQSLMWPK